MVVRKTPQQIKEEILTSLSKKPLSIDDIRKEISSNWSTVNTYLNELSKEGKVKEIFSVEKARIYQRIFGDTYFDLPITDEERKKFSALFNLILQEYKSREEIPTKTHFAKCAVNIIKNNESGLSDLPTIWYLYGLIPQMIANPNLEYQKKINLTNEEKIKLLIKDYIKDNGNKRCSQLKKDQHKLYNEELYIISDCIFDVLKKDNWKNEELLTLLNKFFIISPIDEEFPEIFDLTDDVLSIIEKMSLIGLELKNYRKEILLSFDSLWGLIALYKLYKCKTTGKNAMDKETLIRFYIGGTFELRKDLLRDNLIELNSVYLNKLKDFNLENLKLSKEASEVRKIMAGWTGKD